MKNQLEVGMCVTFKNKYGHTCKGKIKDMGEHLPEEMKAIGGISVTAKPFSHIGDDMDVNCLVRRTSVKVISSEEFDRLPWAKK